MIDFAGEGTGRDFFNSDRNNFAPGFGLAYRIRPNLVFRGGYSINYVVDNNMTVVLNALRGNDGLTQTELRTALAGTVSGGGLTPIPTPEFKVPRTARDQIDSDPTAALFTIDENLKTPYVQQWNVGLQFEPFRDTAFEVRYVGNRGSQLTRAIDLNQVKFPQDFVDDFRRAQNNLLQNGNPFIGEPLTVFPQLGLAGFLQAGFVQSWIANGEIGTYVGAFMVPNRAFFFAGEGGERFGATLGISPFLNNPNIFVADFVGNNAFSKYNGLQFEVRRRFHEGIAGQFNYTFGKVLTNFAGTQSGFRGYFDNAQQNLEVMRPEYDITHTLNANFVWDLPVGQGRRYLNQGGIVDAILGGWQTSGIVRVRSGETVNIVSQRGTINRDGSRATTNTVNLNGLNIGELQTRTGAFRQPDGTVNLFDSSLRGPDGRGNPDVFGNPGLLEAGTLGLSPVSGPWYGNFNMGVRKQFGLPFKEDSFLEFRFDFFNMFNRTNFFIRSTPFAGGVLDDLGVLNRHDINGTDFGLIDETYSPREMQFGVKILF